ncbi:hypothetical protein [Acinetobacter bereziniae]|uniref:hypothetical protein n=1 Tax=Acinetobacter bereziniae TaxID=106648 RepID=UPI001ABCE81C|nr:hypothetical protein [Acinetobacter bereziniae]MBO3655528.1 hypothetical protein [Acinetobacter bereziniae]
MLVSFLDQFDHQEMKKEQIIRLFSQVQAQDLEFSNSGYFVLDIPNQGQIILLFWFVDSKHLILRYDKNIPTAQQGESWLTCNEQMNSKFFDFGDDTWLPLNAIISLASALNSIAMFYDEPMRLPNETKWQNVLDVMWND